MIIDIFQALADILNEIEPVPSFSQLVYDLHFKKNLSITF